MLFTPRVVLVQYTYCRHDMPRSEEVVKYKTTHYYIYITEIPTVLGVLLSEIYFKATKYGTIIMHIVLQ